MKIAKKVLAAVMAVAMIFALSAMAFAETGSIALTAGEVSEKGVVEITITAKNAIGLKSFDLTVSGTEGFTPVKVAEGDMHGAAKDAGNALTYEFNRDKGGFSGYFKENLWDKAAWETAADDMLAELPEGFDPANFVLGVLSARVDSTKYPITVTVTGNVVSESGDFTVNETVTIGATEQPTEAQPTEAQPTEAKPTEAQPTEEQPTEEQPSEEVTAEAPSGNVAPDDGKGNKGTGDNMALAAAAGVVVLAGAAFIITKKRK